MSQNRNCDHTLAFGVPTKSLITLANCERIRNEADAQRMRREHAAAAQRRRCGRVAHWQRFRRVFVAS